MGWDGTQLKHFRDTVKQLQSDFNDMLPIISAMQAAIEGMGGDLGDISTKLVPAGAITMWSGTIANIPSGWALCDGSNGTPNLTDRFIVGAGGEYSPGDTGGSKEVTLTVAQMPQHNHGGTVGLAGLHKHNIQTQELQLQSTSTGGEIVPRINSYGGTAKKTENAGEHSHTISNSGSGNPHENRPPYYALAYIMKL